MEPKSNFGKFKCLALHIYHIDNSLTALMVNYFLATTEKPSAKR